MKHLEYYTRDEIIKCLNEAGLPFNEKSSTEKLRESLSIAIQNGDAPEIETFLSQIFSYSKD